MILASSPESDKAMHCEQYEDCLQLEPKSKEMGLIINEDKSKYMKVI